MVRVVVDPEFGCETSINWMETLVQHIYKFIYT